MMIGIIMVFSLLLRGAPTHAKHRVPSEERQHPQLVRNDKHSRQRPQSRIVGGSNAEPHEFGYFVRYGGCGGSLIAPDIVLTAAHCDGNTMDSTVRVGSYSTTNTGAKIKITKRKVHPEWDDINFRNDFMVLKLNEPVNYPIVAINNDSNLPLEGQRLTVIGMGRLSEDGPVPDTLQKVEVKHIPFEDCISNFKLANKVADDVMICAGVHGGERDSCKGDSGGPLIDRRHDGKDVQVGMVSWGLGCARPGQPGMYSRVSSAYEWLREAVCDLSDDPPQGFCPSQPPSSSPTGDQEELESHLSRSEPKATNPSASTHKTSSPSQLVSVRVEIQTDNFPGEVSYSIHEKDSNLEVVNVPVQTFKIPGALEIQRYGLLPSREYVFRISDSSADGICCRHGRGSYTIIAEESNGEIVLVNGKDAYFGEAKHDFEIPGGKPAPLVAAISSNELLLTIEIELNSSPEEIGWSLQEHGRDHVVFGSREFGYYTKVFGKVSEAVLIPADTDLSFVLVDRGGSGRVGNSYSIYLGKTSPESAITHGDGTSIQTISWEYLSQKSQEQFQTEWNTMESSSAYRGLRGTTFVAHLFLWILTFSTLR